MFSNHSAKDALHNFDRATIQRGRVYYKQGRVLDIVLESPHSFLAEVSGSYTYSQKIIIHPNHRMSGACNCPVGLNCKHVVAAIYKYLDLDIPYINETEPKPTTLNPSQKWLNMLIEANTQKPKVVSTPQYGEDFLIYKLFEDKYNDGSQLEFCRTRMLKKGGISKGKYVSRENMFYDYRWKNYVNEEDKVLIGKLNNLVNNSNSYSDSVVFEGEYGTQVLKELLETKRCFYEENTEPLQWLEKPKTLLFEWEKRGAYNTITSNLETNEFLVTSTTPILCVNHETNSIYAIKTPYNPKTINILFHAPNIPNKEIAHIATTMLDKLPTLPLPKSVKLKELHTSLVPHLHLYGKKNLDKTMHCMRLTFQYGDHTVSAYPANTFSYISKGNESIKIIRNTQDEEACTECIEQEGFIYEESQDAYLSFANPSMQEAIERWRVFTESTLPRLKKEGWKVIQDDTFKYQFEYMENITVESTQSETNNWFELSFSVELGGHTLSLLPIVSSLLEEFDSVDKLPLKLNLQLENGRFLHIDTDEIRPILTTIFELFDKRDDDKLILEPHDAHLLDIDEESNIVWKGAEELKVLSEKLKKFENIEMMTPAPTLNATLREYQTFGLSWLHFLYDFKFSGILADDMGLGKTIQTLAFLQLLKHRGELDKPSLIIMPTSLLGNWKNEILKFTPELSVLTLYGIDRAKEFEKIDSYDIVITTYQLAQRDKEKYENFTFKYLILDEAQKIKNPKTKMAVAIKSFNASHKIALSGTPIENHLGELWSIFDFLMPGFLDNLKTFRNYYQLPIEEEHNLKRKEQLNQKIAPFILRRTKEVVATELPAKTEIVLKAAFQKKQATLYENIRVSMEKKVRDVVKNKGLSRSHITILDALLKLRQVCCHPHLLKLDSAKNIHDSAKLEIFLELIEELHAEGRKVLVFSQFTSMLSILEEEIKKRKFTYAKLTGATRKREEMIEKFTKGEASIFLISLKAGGTGLNLVEADTVIHYDPWWNPAVENQATDRAYRIGQDKPVFVYKLIVENSIEEKILQLQEKKKSLQDGIYSHEEQGDNDIFNGEELLSLLQL
ncbi:COG0553: Superfamily II DNA/RNA helicases, SNF2 family [hydrothermal vent metagenome]|uniref:COG0553: Superfamily II DNA/RNA helicases, SNF2 family n=1 Tax=hydrothermal vent metagenome TaxID=652676 RepID=A0A1W1CM47_9ZZZZ